MIQPSKKFFVVLNIVLVGVFAFRVRGLVRQRARMGQQPPGASMPFDPASKWRPPSSAASGVPQIASGKDLARVPPSIKLQAIKRLDAKAETALTPTQAVQILAVVNELDARMKARSFSSLLEFRQFVGSRVKIVMGLLTAEQVKALQQGLTELYADQATWTQEEKLSDSIVSFRTFLEARAARVGSVGSGAAATASPNPQAPRLVAPVQGSQPASPPPQASPSAPSPAASSNAQPASAPSPTPSTAAAPTTSH